MLSLSKKEARAFRETVERIGDERVRYFYMMLGDALADAMAPKAMPHIAPANTGPVLVAEIEKRVNAQ